MSLLNVNWLAVVVGAAINMVIGFLWYGPLFGKLWTGMMEKTGWKRDQARGNLVLYLLNLVVAFVASYVLALILRKFGISQWWKGLGYGAIVWVGVGATGTLTSSLFESRPKGLWLLFALYQFVVYAGLGVMFTLWK